MKRLAFPLVAFVLACGNDHRPPDDDTDNNDVPFTECGADPASFVRQTFLALDGRRPKSQAEVDVYVDLFEATKAAGSDPKEAVARAIMAQPEFGDRWLDATMDAIHVQRLDVQTEASCWDSTNRATVDAGLAMAVRTMGATTQGDGKGTWTMLDLAKSAVALDDLTPIYRAQLFSMVAHPIPAANVPPIEAELARRADFGETFDAAYLHRDMVCLGCHNSEHSVTDSDDEAADRHWPVPGLAELAVFGMSTGVAPDRAHAPFRVEGFVMDRSGSRPWGWDPGCGVFSAIVGDDPAGIDGKLASISGKRSTVYTLEQALARGFDKLRGAGPPLEANGAITDPDAALAWLVTLKMTEDIWKKTTGTSLTIANYFPRNQAASDLLNSLATRYAQSGYSLKALLVAIVQSDYFNRKPAELGCGKNPYTYPAVFDPWVTADADPVKRRNGPGDLVTAIDARTLVAATNAALDWTAPPMASRFPDYGDGCETESCSQMQGYCNQFGSCCNAAKACMMNGVLPAEEVPFERGVGMFLRNSERGFRGLDFQARLVWEERYGACVRPRWVAADFIDNIIAATAADPSATVGDVVAAIKDRLIGEPGVFDGSEASALAAIFGKTLDQPAAGVTAEQARILCGSLLESPQFLLQGIAGRGGDRPKLTPAAASYDTVCTDVATHVAGVACTNGKLTLAAH
ncbi:MAG TPA: hypothetical protein VMZ53_32880 [Kofleriaceae bacterium]|nr:hypothetical protein [Kofleriaceae bacterium]